MKYASILHCVVPMLCVGLLPGCATLEKKWIEPGYRPPAVTVGVHTFVLSEQKACTLNYNKQGQIITNDVSFKTIYDVAAKSGTDEPSKAARNFLVTQIMAASDDLVERHKALILGNYAFTNASLGILTSLTGGLVTVFNDTATKSALGASSAVLNSSRSTVNEQVFLNQLATTIVSAIEKERQKLRSEIEGKLGKETKYYSVEQALFDVQAYHNAGSFAHGLVIISESLSKQRETVGEIQTRIEGLRNLKDKADSAGQTQIDVEINRLIQQLPTAPIK